MSAEDQNSGGVETTGRRRRILIPAGIIVGLVLLIFGISYLVYASHHVSTDDAQIEGDVTTVAPRVKGQITAVYVHENQLVHKGDLLLTIDPRDFVAAVAQAQAALEQARGAAQAAAIGVPMQSALTIAQTSQAQAGVAQSQSAAVGASAKIGTAQAAVLSADAGVGVAKAQLDSANAALTKAANDRDRAKTLIAAGAISHQQFDATEAAYQSAVAAQQSASISVTAAQAGVVQAQSNLEQAQAGASAAGAQISASQAQLAQALTGNDQNRIKSAQALTGSAQQSAAQAALDIAKLQLSYTRVIAPIDGIVSKKSVNVGDNVAVAQPVMAIAAQTHLWVTANLKETQLERVRVGDPVAISVDAYPHIKFTGTVTSIAAATGATFALIPPDNATGNFTKVVQRVPVRIMIDPASDPNHLLRQGLSTEVAIDTSSQR
jgi:membrane fusion protein (multidrug efflux system)